MNPVTSWIPYSEIRCRQRIAEGLDPMAHIPRIPESVDTSMAAFWFRSGHKDDLMQREIWGGFRKDKK